MYATKKFFLKPKHHMQRRYEALRASYVDGLPLKEICKKFGYTEYSFKSIKRDSKDIKGEIFFKDLKKGPKGPHKKTLLAKKLIINLRKNKFSVDDIKERLAHEGLSLSVNHINNLLRKEGFLKLHRRTKKQRLKILKKG